ncbi:MAG: SIS domain-containing protein [Thermoplasmata archaeon]
MNSNRSDVRETANTIIDAPKIFIYGAGRSGLVGRTFAMRLMQLGQRAFFIGETITPAVKDEDCVLFVSKTGETQTAIQAARIVSNRVKAKKIVLTSSPESPLASFADVLMVLDIPRTQKDASLAPLGTIFENAAMVFLDALTALIMDEIGESEENMRERHPILV